MLFIVRQKRVVILDGVAVSSMAKHARLLLPSKRVVIVSMTMVVPVVIMPMPMPMLMLMDMLMPMLIFMPMLMFMTIVAMCVAMVLRKRA